MESDRTERIKKLRGILEDIGRKCGACVHIGTWYCNRECMMPTAQVIAEEALREEGEYVHALDKTNL